MAIVPYTFAGQSGAIPLTELDVNFSNVKTQALTAIQVTGSSQPNITQIGTLSSITVTGNAVLGGVNFGNTGISGTGNVTSQTFLGNVSYGNGSISGTGTVTAGTLLVGQNAQIFGNLTVFGTTTSVNSNTITTNDLTATLGNNQSTGAALDTAGLLIGSSNIARFQFNNFTTSWLTNINLAPSANIGANLGATTLYWNNVYANNVIAVGAVSATTLQAQTHCEVNGFITATGNVTSGASIVASQLVRGTTVSATGNVNAGSAVNAANVITSGTVQAGVFQGPGTNITGIAANLSVGQAAYALQTANASSAATLNTALFSVVEFNNKLYFRYNGVDIMSLDGAGNLVTKLNMTAFSTP